MSDFETVRKALDTSLDHEEFKRLRPYAALDRIEAIVLDHLGGDEHHKGCARELAFITEVAGTWKSEVVRLKAKLARLREDDEERG